jgi:DNA-binding transcriptional regulator GbsR (MarR family)
MEVDGLFTSPKWKIIEEISSEPQSPMQLAEKLATSVANISQQLRLLEVAGLVKKRRVSERARGKPRVIFSLTNDFCYLLTASEGFAKKRMLKLEDYHLFIIKIWMLEDSSLHEELMDFYSKLKPYLEKVDAVFVRNTELTLCVKAGYNGPKDFLMVKRLKPVIALSKDIDLGEAQASGAYFLFSGKPGEKSAKREAEKQRS